MLLLLQAAQSTTPQILQPINLTVVLCTFLTIAGGVITTFINRGLTKEVAKHAEFVKNSLAPPKEQHTIPISIIPKLPTLPPDIVIEDPPPTPRDRSVR